MDTAVDDSISLTAPIRFFTDLVKDVFVQDDSMPNTAINNPNQQALQYLLSELPVVFDAISIVWKALRVPYQRKAETKLRTSLGLLQLGGLQAKTLIERTITSLIVPLFTKYPSQFFASLIILWANNHPELATSSFCEEHEVDHHIMDMLNHVDTILPEQVVSYLVEVILRIKKQEVKSKNSNIKLRENYAIHFLLFYLNKSILTSNSAMILNSLLILIREMLQHTSTLQDTIVLCLMMRCMHQYLARWPASDTPKVRHAMKEVVHKLFEASITLAVKESTKPQQELDMSTHVCLRTISYMLDFDCFYAMLCRFAGKNLFRRCRTN